jgi:hypothetical protein
MRGEEGERDYPSLQAGSTIIHSARRQQDWKRQGQEVIYV